MNFPEPCPDPHPVTPPQSRELPTTTIRTIRRFPKPHADLFDLALTLPSWLQFLESAPTLAFLVARCWLFDGLPETEAPARIRAYLLMRRSAICGALGFSPTTKTVRILSRIKTGGWPNCLPLLILRELLRREPSTMDILEHLPEISAEDIERLAIGGTGNQCLMIRNCRQVASLGWFFQLPAAKRFFLGSLYEKTRQDRELAEVAFLETIRPLAALRNERKAIAYLQDFQCRRDLIKGACRKIRNEEVADIWPSPPLTGTQSIVPITSLKELALEGHIMRHCVAGLTLEILQGKYFVYRISAPQRCTLSLRFRDGQWTVDQLLGRNNAAVSDPTVCQEVEEWLGHAPSHERNASTSSKFLHAIAHLTGLPIRRKYAGVAKI